MNADESELEAEVRIALNRCSAENKSGTPDFILARYLLDCLNAFNSATKSRDLWKRPGGLSGFVLMDLAIVASIAMLLAIPVMVFLGFNGDCIASHKEKVIHPQSDFFATVDGKVVKMRRPGYESVDEVCERRWP